MLMYDENRIPPMNILSVESLFGFLEILPHSLPSYLGSLDSKLSGYKRRFSTFTFSPLFWERCQKVLLARRSQGKLFLDRHEEKIPGNVLSFQSI